ASDRRVFVLPVHASTSGAGTVSRSRSGLASRTIASRSCGNGNGSRRSLSTKAKTAVVAPIPRPSARTQARVTPGLLHRERGARRTAWSAERIRAGLDGNRRAGCNPAELLASGAAGTSAPGRTIPETVRSLQPAGESGDHAVHPGAVGRGE